jgi:hypothetical protein
MKTEEKHALLAETSLLHGKITLLTLVTISIQEAMNRCDGDASSTQIARARKVFRSLLKGFTREKLLKLTNRFRASIEDKPRAEIISIIDNLYIRTISRQIILRHMIEENKKKLEKKSK